MRIVKNHSLISLANGFVIDAPTPSNISYLWNFGSLLGICLIIQIITGVTLAMHYNPSVLEAFNSVEHIMRDVNNGWLIRYLHSNTASAFFFLVYLHIGRGLYYGSYQAPRTLTWTIGTVIFILMMATAFLGYYVSPKWFITNLSEMIWPVFLIDRTPCQRNYSTDKRDLLSDFLYENKLNPVLTFRKLSLLERDNIRNQLRGISGIYMIFNDVTGDYYVGSAITNRLYTRFCNHLIYLNGSKLVKNAVNKYGMESFSFLIIDVFLEEIDRENNKKLLSMEDYYLKTLSPKYNILTEAGSSFGYKHTELSRIKMRANYSIRRRSFIDKVDKSIDFNLEIEKSFNSPIKYLSKETLIQMNSKAITNFNLDKTIYGDFSPLDKADKKVNKSNITIKTEKETIEKRSSAISKKK